MNQIIMYYNSSKITSHQLIVWLFYIMSLAFKSLKSMTYLSGVWAIIGNSLKLKKWLAVKTNLSLLTISLQVLSIFPGQDMDWWWWLLKGTYSVWIIINLSSMSNSKDYRYIITDKTSRNSRICWRLPWNMEKRIMFVIYFPLVLLLGMSLSERCLH